MEANALLVTGGSRGIGAAIVRGAAARGYRTCFTYRQDEEAAEQLSREMKEAGHRVVAIRVGGPDPIGADEVIRRANAELGLVTSLVNNAGITGTLGAFAQRDLAEVREVFELNVFGTMSYSREMLLQWLEAGASGAIVNISSIAATTGAPGEYVHYAASKAAIESFTIGLAKEVAALGVRVNAVAPGTVQTDIHEAAGDKERPKRIASIAPMRRVGRPEEVAQAVLWLLSEEASYTTGAVLRVGGGL